MSKMTPEETELVDRAKEQLLEHFDSVRIFVTKHNGSESETDAYSVGGGNFYAQYGHVEEWRQRQIAIVRKHETSE